MLSFINWLSFKFYVSEEKSIDILVVDDESSIRLLLKTILSKIPETKVYTAGSPAKALELIQENRNYLIISDIDMPCMNGFEFEEKSRNLGYAGFIFMSGNKVKHEEKAKERGIDILEKPFNVYKLYGFVKPKINTLHK